MVVPILKGNLEHGISIKTVEFMGLQEKCQAKYLWRKRNSVWVPLLRQDLLFQKYLQEKFIMTATYMSATITTLYHMSMLEKL